MRYREPPEEEGEGYAAVAHAINRLRDEIGQRHVENSSSLEVVEGELKVLINRVDDLAKGFPNKDPDGHRRAHEVLIRKTEARAKFYEDLRAELAKKGLWALVIGAGAGLWWIAGVVWMYVRTKVTH